MSRKKTYHSPLQIHTDLTKDQKKITNFFRSNHVSILTADPGCGKTHVAIHFAIQQLLDKTYEKIIISKPLIEVGSSIGFLPGTEEEKTSVYLDSYVNTFIKILGTEGFRELKNSKKLEFKPVNYCRGTTLEYSLVIMDEAQGLTMHELMTFVTRVSDTSKILILGDPLQVDIKKSGLNPFIKLSEGIEGISHLHLGPEYQMRSKMIVELYNRYKNYLNQNGNGN